MSFQKNCRNRIRTLSSNSSENGDVVLRKKSDSGSIGKSFYRQSSIGALEELVQCGICLDRFKDPRMLACQHTFCFECLQTHMVAKDITTRTRAPSSDEIKNCLDTKPKILCCPICQQEFILEKGLNSVDDLPVNFYIDSLIGLLNNNNPGGFNDNSICSKCQICTTKRTFCQHCKKYYCGVCWSAHLKELSSNMQPLFDQLEDSTNLLNHKTENFLSRCDQLGNKIQDVFEDKIKELKRKQSIVLEELKIIRKDNEHISENIISRIKGLKGKLMNNIGENDEVETFMNLHRETSALLSEIHYFGEARLIFDTEKMIIDQESEGIYNDDNVRETINVSLISNPLENETSLVGFYKKLTFSPKLVWTNCPKPAGLGMAPWDESKIFITATDRHVVTILDRKKTKVCGHLKHTNMLFPCSIAFSLKRKQIFVSDKWMHCVHVFDHNGKYVKKIYQNKIRNPHGIAVNEKDELVICDTGNNRLLTVNPDNGCLINCIGQDSNKSELNMPTDIAIYKNNYIIADSGNFCIKVYRDGQKIKEFGSLGRNQCQFRSAEVLCVDPMGFILVGDAGNARIQVFKPNGTLVKIFGSSEKGFRWISGILVTPNMEIVTTDEKTRTMRIF